MTDLVASRPLWAGRVTVILGIILISLNLRTAVAALSPIVDLVSADIPLNSVGLGVLGTLPPLAFAACGFLAPAVARRIGLETTVVLACAAMLVGPLLRAASTSFGVLLLGAAVALTGMGLSNILLPPLVKKYFPDRIGQVTAGYLTLMSLSVAVPPLLAAPLADVGGWRFAAGIWAVLALGALVPWLVVRGQHSRIVRAEGAVAAPRADLLGAMRHSRVAWAITVTFSVTALGVYAFFAWLPELLVDRSHVSPAQAGALLSLFGIIGLPLALITPLLVARIRNVAWLILAGVGCFVVGYLGLLLVPTVLPWLWVTFAGVGALLFPLCLVLINLRTRSPEASVALSGFVQSIAYGAGALGPLLVGIIHDATGEWTVPLLFLLVMCLVGIVGAVILAKPRFVEDDLAAHEAASRS